MKIILGIILLTATTIINTPEDVIICTTSDEVTICN